MRWFLTQGKGDHLNLRGICRLLSQPQAVIYVTGAVFQIGVVLYFNANFDAAILRLMPDDAFYYLKIAENISNGLGSVFSVGEPTNGYHPLWMVILTLVHRLTQPTEERFVVWALLLAVGFNILAAHLLGRLLRAFGFSKVPAWLGVAGYLFLPWMVNLTLTGLETPLFYVCLFGFLLVAQQWLTRESDLALGDSLWLGATAGLAMLARTDAIFFTLFVSVIVLIKKGFKSLPFLLAAGALSTLILLPWLIWNLVTFGTIVQSSSVAISVLAHYFAPPVLGFEYWKRALENFTWMSYWALFAPFLTHTEYAPRFVELYGLVHIGMLIGAGAAYYRRFVTRDLNLALILFLPTSLLSVFYFAVRLFAQVWHMSTLYILVIVFLLNFVPKRAKSVHVFVFILLVLPLTAYSMTNGYFRPQEWTGRVAYFEGYRSDSPDPLTICVTDSGIPGYFASHTVVNLDGVVNNRVLHYIVEGRFSDYVALLECDEVTVDEGRLRFYDRNMPTQPAERSEESRSVPRDSSLRSE